MNVHLIPENLALSVAGFSNRRAPFLKPKGCNMRLEGAYFLNLKDFRHNLLRSELVSACLVVDQ